MNYYSFLTCKNNTCIIPAHSHVLGAKLTTVRRMKQKFPFPKEKGGVMECPCEGCQGHAACHAAAALPAEARQGCVENSWSLPRVHCTKPL